MYVLRLFGQNTSMKNRITLFFCVITLLFCYLVAHMGVLATHTALAEAAYSQTVKTITIDTERANFLDRNNIRLTGATSQNMGIFTGDSQLLQSYQDYYTAENFAAAKTLVQTGIAFSLPVNLSKDKENLYVFKNYLRYSTPSLCPHIIGYDNDGVGVAGLEYALNDFLSVNTQVSQVKLYVNAVGQVIDTQLVDYNRIDPYVGVQLAIDANIQKIVQQVGEEHIKSGAIVVLSTTTGEILASASFPTYNQSDILSAMEGENSPLLNKAFTAYSVGSVFKLAISAAALEAGFDPNTCFNCTGQVEVDGTVYHCHNLSGHGNINMYQAIQESCNCYFVQLAPYLNQGYLLSYMHNMGFGETTTLAPNYQSGSGNLPTAQQLKTDIQNFCFGQGKLQATPLQIAAMVNTIANGGKYLSPKLILSYNGKSAPKLIAQQQKQLISPQNNRILQQAMEMVVASGTGHRAKSDNFAIAGKTATAQTGIFNGDIEQTNAWFAGYFPADNPQYTMVVMLEDGGEGSVSAAPVFLQIAEKICLTNNE